MVGGHPPLSPAPRAAYGAGRPLGKLDSKPRKQRAFASNGKPDPVSSKKTKVAAASNEPPDAQTPNVHTSTVQNPVNRSVLRIGEPHGIAAETETARSDMDTPHSKIHSAIQRKSEGQNDRPQPSPDPSPPEPSQSEEERPPAATLPRILALDLFRGQQEHPLNRLSSAAGMQQQQQRQRHWQEQLYQLLQQQLHNELQQQQRQQQHQQRQHSQRHTQQIDLQEHHQQLQQQQQHYQRHHHHHQQAAASSLQPRKDPSPAASEGPIRPQPLRRAPPALSESAACAWQSAASPGAAPRGLHAFPPTPLPLSAPHSSSPAHPPGLRPPSPASPPGPATLNPALLAAIAVARAGLFDSPPRALAPPALYGALRASAPGGPPPTAAGLAGLAGDGCVGQRLAGPAGPARPAGLVGGAGGAVLGRLSAGADAADLPLALGPAGAGRFV